MFGLHIAHNSGCTGVGAEQRGINLDIVEGLGVNLLELHPSLAGFSSPLAFSRRSSSSRGQCTPTKITTGPGIRI